MTVARSTGAFFGTSESSGVSINAGATHNGAEVDVLGGTDSYGDVHLYLVATPASGKLDCKVRLNRRRATGEAYTNTQEIDVKRSGQAATAMKLYLGLFPASRYMAASLINESSVYSSNLTNVAVLYELEKVT